MWARFYLRTIPKSFLHRNFSRYEFEQILQVFSRKQQLKSFRKCTARRRRSETNLIVQLKNRQTTLHGNNNLNTGYNFQTTSQGNNNLKSNTDITLGLSNDLPGGLYSKDTDYLEL